MIFLILYLLYSSTRKCFVIWFHYSSPVLGSHSLDDICLILFACMLTIQKPLEAPQIMMLNISEAFWMSKQMLWQYLCRLRCPRLISRRKTVNTRPPCSESMNLCISPAIWVTDSGIWCPDNNWQHGIPAVHLKILKQGFYLRQNKTVQ